jgi:ATP-dependent DNA ligase
MHGFARDAAKEGHRIEGKGKSMYEQVCLRDMEGIVCKPMVSPYGTVRGKATWIKIKNPNYSQAEGARRAAQQTSDVRAGLTD